MKKTETGEKKCGCPCHKMGGILVAAFGLSFLLKALGVYDDHVNNIVWPSIVILAGLKKAFAGMCNCCDGSGICKKEV